MNMLMRRNATIRSAMSVEPGDAQDPHASKVVFFREQSTWEFSDMTSGWRHGFTVSIWEEGMPTNTEWRMKPVLEDFDF